MSERLARETFSYVMVTSFTFMEISFLAVAQITGIKLFDEKLFFLGHKVFFFLFSFYFLTTRCSKSLNFDHHVLFILSITSPGCLARSKGENRQSESRDDFSLFHCSLSF